MDCTIPAVSRIAFLGTSAIMASPVHMRATSRSVISGAGRLKPEAALTGARGFRLITSECPPIRTSDKAQANIAATGTVLNSRPMTTMPESVTCHPRARSASRS